VITEKFTMDSYGNVGIGITSPDFLLDVGGTVHLRGQNGGPGLYVNETGNVGIGTTSPATNVKLDVNGDVKVGGVIRGDSNGNVIVKLGN